METKGAVGLKAHQRPCPDWVAATLVHHKTLSRGLPILTPNIVEHV